MAEAAPVQMVEFSQLQVPLVLKTIFEGSTVAELKEYRKVCQLWNLESSKVLRESARFGIGNGIRSVPEKRLEELTTLADNEKCNITKTSCFPESVLFFHPNATEYDSRFWRHFGSHIKNLDLSGVAFPSAKDFREAIFDSCPNLERLELYLVRILGVDGPRSSFPEDDFLTEEEDPKTDNDSNDYPSGRQIVNENLKYLGLWGLRGFPSSLFQELFHSFPNLEALLVIDCYYNSRAIFSALRDWLQGGDGRGDKLKEVKLCLKGLEDPDSTARLLTSGKLRLEKLELRNCTRRLAHAARTILDGHAATLKKLTLHGTAYDNQENSQFPVSNGVVLVKLEEMKLDNLGQLKSTNLWKCVPNLKKLVLQCFYLAGTVRAVSIQELQDVALTSCAEVELWVRYEDGGDDQAEIARKLTTLLPNVKKLRLVSSESEVFAIVCQAFPKLVELSVLVCNSQKIFDSAITGLDVELVEKINREGPSGDWNPESEPRAGLAKLKDLNVLSIRCDKGLGYSSAVAGIQRLRQLQQLELDFQEVDEEVWNGIWKPLLDQFPWRGN